MTDGKRKLQVYRIVGSQHSDAMLIAYLPAEKILIEADLYTPGAEGAATVLSASVGQGSGADRHQHRTEKLLYDNIKRQKLDVETIAPLHGRVVKMADLLKDLGQAN